jgi:hypothetical protein
MQQKPPGRVQSSVLFLNWWRIHGAVRRGYCGHRRSGGEHSGREGRARSELANRWSTHWATALRFNSRDSSSNTLIHSQWTSTAACVEAVSKCVSEIGRCKLRSECWLYRGSSVVASGAIAICSPVASHRVSDIRDGAVLSLVVLCPSSESIFTLPGDIHSASAFSSSRQCSSRATSLLPTIVVDGPSPKKQVWSVEQCCALSWKRGASCWVLQMLACWPGVSSDASGHRTLRRSSTIQPTARDFLAPLRDNNIESVNCKGS